MPEIIRTTSSLCPVCLKKIKANIVELNGNIYMDKTCSEHGNFRTIVWQDNKENYLKWYNYRDKPEENGKFINTSTPKLGCPFDCGLCTSHAKQIVSAALMTSNVCNIGCPVCFTKTSAQGRYYPTLDELKRQIDNYLEEVGEGYPIELCGGEPTVREDLPEIIKYCKSIGIDHIQLNTNGIKFSEDEEYAYKLKESGLSVAYLGFDGFNNSIYEKKYGKNILDKKIKAIESFKKSGIATVLAGVVVPNSNDNELGKIVQLAKEYSPTIRGINFQPISYLGTFPSAPKDEDRITIPKVIRNLSDQTNGEIKFNDFVPSTCEHPICSFNAMYMIDLKGKLKAMTDFNNPNNEPSSAKKVREVNKRMWSSSKVKTLTIGGMAFMDVWNIDTERLKRCRIGIISKNNGIVPLCAQYVTSINGKKIYNDIC